MSARGRRAAASVLLQLTVMGWSAGSALATDDYTLPFSAPGVTMSYGVDRDPALNRQLDWTGQTWKDGVPHLGRVYDQHTGVDYPMVLRSEVAAAKDGTVVDEEGGFGTSQFGSFGNFVLLQHADGRRTLYYHLASRADGGISVAVGNMVVAGQPIGRSGCSGICYGAHLHFEMLAWSSSAKSFVPADPLAERRWTTWPGRIPFDASYVRESNAGTEVIRRGQTITHWVEFRNTGGRAWRSTGTVGRVALATWSPAAHASLFSASDWPLSWMATFVDLPSVPPDGVGRFTFGLRGSPAPGSYRETFNLIAQSVRWFDHARLGGYYVPIVISNLTP
jgi:murein DD-endopeptidase MepM/ murein hydrolase activator NlpD